MRTERKIINLYNDNKIYSMKQVMSITTEEDLDQFWNYLSNLQAIERYLTHDFISQFYNFSLSLLKSKKTNFFEIIIEESDKKIYFTLWNKNIALKLHKYLEKKNFKYLYEDSRISTRLKKLRLQKKNDKKKKEDKCQYIEKKVIPIYTFINNDDLQELLSLSDDMQELMIQIEKIGLTKDLFIELRSKISIFALTLRYYNEITTISTTITDFSNLLNTNKDIFLNLDNSEVSLIQGFIYNIDYWFQTMFINGGSELKCMDNSIKEDYAMLANIISPSKIQLTEEDFDDMFDF